MAKKAKVKEVTVESTEFLGGGLIKITMSDGSIIFALTITQEVIDLIAPEADDDDDDDSDDDDDDDDDDSDDDDDDEVTAESLAEMDYEELEDVCDDKDLDTDPDDFDEEEVEKLRSAIAKELGIKLPKAAKKGKK